MNSIRNNFKNKESYLQFVKEWKSFHRIMVNESRAQKLSVKSLNTALNSASTELGHRIPYSFYTNLCDAQIKRRSTSAFITVAMDMHNLACGNKAPTRMPINHYVDNAEMLVAAIKRMTLDGILSNPDAVLDACRAGVSVAMNSEKDMDHG